MARDANLAAVLKDGARRALRTLAGADVFAERNEQPVDLDPIALR
jgi:hypothetical protein